MSSIEKETWFFQKIFGSKKIPVQQEENKQKIAEVLHEPKGEEIEPEVFSREKTFAWETPEETKNKIREVLRDTDRKFIMHIYNNRAIDSLCGPSDTFYLMKMRAHMEDWMQITRKLQNALLDVIEENSSKYGFDEKEKMLMKNFISGYPNIKNEDQ